METLTGVTPQNPPFPPPAQCTLLAAATSPFGEILFSSGFATFHGPCVALRLWEEQSMRIDGETLALILRVFGEDLTPEVVAMVKSRLRFTPEKLALLLVRALNPEEVLSEREECVLRGISDKTLRGMKQRGELPAICSGTSTACT